MLTCVNFLQNQYKPLLSSLVIGIQVIELMQHLSLCDSVAAEKYKTFISLVRLCLIKSSRRMSSSKNYRLSTGVAISKSP